MFLFFKDIRDGAKHLSHMCKIYGTQHWRKFSAEGDLVWLATRYFEAGILAYCCRMMCANRVDPRDKSVVYEDIFDATLTTKSEWSLFHVYRKSTSVHSSCPNSVSRWAPEAVICVHICTAAPSHPERNQGFLSGLQLPHLSSSYT